MSVTLDKVVPWGRSLDEYRLMFDLSEDDLRSKILGCGDGPASFNAEMRELGRRVISFDPIYSFAAGQIERRVEESFDAIISQCKAAPDDFVWSYFKDPDHLGRHRLAAMRKFLDDFGDGLKEGRYVAASLPSLGFAANEFDLALCSHLLFLYSEQLSLDFHLASIREMCRAAREARIFPLVDLSCKRSAHVEPVISRLSDEGFVIETVRVPYEFARGGDEMMRVRLVPAAENRTPQG